MHLKGYLVYISPLINHIPYARVSIPRVDSDSRGSSLLLPKRYRVAPKFGSGSLKNPLVSRPLGTSESSLSPFQSSKKVIKK